MAEPEQGLIGRLAPEDRAALLARLTLHSYAPDELLISQADETRDVFFLLEGRVRVTIYSEEGKAVDYRDIGAGGFFGEIAAIDGGPRSASVIAVEPVRGGWLRGRDFRELLQTRPGIALAVMQHFTAMIRRLTERVFEFSTLQVRERLVMELIRLAEAAGVKDGRAEIRPAPTHFEIASRISTHREAVSREMSALAKEGILRKRERALQVLSVQRLKDWVEE
ncbi:MAG TPA: Crp/Fnr family transcriptional regulator [Paracoccaceae bacterium]|nr:Crp/Fnr family transcriptional regulator [Paracoccaceae bacterium]